jgi:integrase
MLNYIENYKRVNEIKKEMEFFTYEEFKKFISVVDEFNYKTFFETLYYLGLRQGECCALTWDDIDFNKKEVSINKTLTTKLKGQLYTLSSPKTANSNRTLPIPLKLLKSYEKLLKQAKTKKYFKTSWFIFGDELPFRETTIQVRKNKYCKLSGVKQIRIHDFRHSCASFLIQHGASIVLVSKYLGHSKISTTLDTYTHLYKNELLEVSKMIDTL